jgi:hypothetical protein
VDVTLGALPAEGNHTRLAIEMAGCGELPVSLLRFGCECFQYSE